MEFHDYKKIIRERSEINSEWYSEIEKMWEKMTDIFSRDVEKTIMFLETDCTGDEFIWLSEIFEEIAEKTQSKEFIECLYKTAEKFPDETKKYNIISFVDDAADMIS